MWQCDFRSKKSHELMVSDEVREESKFLSVFNAALESFVHKTLKDEQIKCILRIVCHGRDVLTVLLTRFGKSAIYQLFPKVSCFVWAAQPTPHQKPPLLWEVRWTTSESNKLLLLKSVLRLLGNQSKETAKSRMESSTLRLEVPNNGLASSYPRLLIIMA